MPNASPEGVLRVASWNIHGAIGRDGRCDPERIARVVRAMDADVVALQEVDGRTHLGRRPNPFETMANLLGGHVVEARLFGKPGREHGNLLWSRRPISSSTIHLLAGGLEQRGLIEIEIDGADGHRLTVFATHLGLSPLTRSRQTRQIVELIGSVSPGPCVLVGDLNEWSPTGPVHRRLSEVLPVSQRPPTFPARWPFVRLDRLYASAGLRSRTVAPPLEAPAASDHLPLVVDLSVETEPGSRL